MPHNQARGPLHLDLIWFDPYPRAARIPPAIYYQSPATKRIPGLMRRPFTTLHNRLDLSAESQLSLLNSTTRNEIRRGDTAGLEMREVAIDEFIDLYNNVAVERQLRQIDRFSIERWGAHLELLGAYSGKDLLVAHGVVKDLQESRRARLLYSVSSALRRQDGHQSSVANRWLHWQEMQEFASQGTLIYDWGGYSPLSLEAKVTRIAKFKAAFGGQPVTESVYVPAIWRLVQDVRQVLSKHSEPAD